MKKEMWIICVGDRGEDGCC